MAHTLRCGAYDSIGLSRVPARILLSRSKLRVPLYGLPPSVTISQAQTPNAHASEASLKRHSPNASGAVHRSGMTWLGLPVYPPFVVGCASPRSAILTTLSRESRQFRAARS